MPTQPLADPKTLIIFTTAAAGLGHLRVTHALAQGLPDGLRCFVLGATDKTLSYLHRLSSVNPYFAEIQNLIQYQPFAERIFTDNYRRFLRSHTQDIYYQLQTVLSSIQPPVKTAVVVATHFSLAHQIAEIKDKLSQETGIKVKLYVIVTDDTFHLIWGTDGADIIFLPSNQLKLKYKQYFKAKGFKIPKMVVNPYPIPPGLNKTDTKVYHDRKLQVDPQNNHPTGILIPISGAAVQLDYFTSLIRELGEVEGKPFDITVVSKQAPFTQSFIHVVKTFPNVSVYEGTTNQATVQEYLNIFDSINPPALEITKPSEQAFKALFEPEQLGGVIMLFSEPVGRQEYDNLEFLRRHELIPSRPEESELIDILTSPKPVIPERIFKKAHTWRALRLPLRPQQAARFIRAARKTGMFQEMVTFRAKPTPETGDDGVARFWKLVSKEIRE